MKRMVKDKTESNYCVWLNIDVSMLREANVSEYPGVATDGSHMNHPNNPAEFIRQSTDEKLDLLNKTIELVKRYVIGLGLTIVEERYVENSRNYTHPPKTTYFYYISARWDKDEQLSKFEFYISIRDRGLSKFPEGSVHDPETQIYKAGINFKITNTESDIAALESIIGNHVSRFKTFAVEAVDRSNKLIPLCEQVANELSLTFRFDRNNRGPVYRFFNETKEAVPTEYSLFVAETVDDIKLLVSDELMDKC